ncbi:hypothetical protein TBC1_1132 [Lentimicrobium saccharophilum]|uniref:PD(D/E)XK endonuclease domain-containing protein n=1 Tax=Lentimicrobium saccharophilum TaxID=1678841 RepID=A0A0S7BUX6_9BACT|nr:hypothetical protein [Lentimicrobium saccharophilum]GAP41906.1 hypothetical protein TBC1_1132 [Lentimicrobium saccharophilum]
MKGYNTNLASEYYVLATLYRLGFDAYITLGNKKGIDIILNLNDEKQLTIDVKGLQGTTLFPLDNVNEKADKPNHFIVFLSFLNKMDEISVVPEMFVIPHNKVKDFLYQNPKGNRKGINLSMLRNSAIDYKNNWNQLK